MVGAVIGNYQIVRRLGEGGMGVVYLGRHTLLGRHAAIKVLLPELSIRTDIVNRFFNEARAVTSISDLPPKASPALEKPAATDGSATGANGPPDKDIVTSKVPEIPKSSLPHAGAGSESATSAKKRSRDLRSNVAAAKTATRSAASTLSPASASTGAHSDPGSTRVSTAPLAPAPPSSCGKAVFAAVYNAAVPPPGSVRAALRNLKICHDAGSISDADFEQTQAALVARM